MARGRGGFIGQDGLNAPDSPTNVSASAGNAQATVSFTAPTDVGGSAITGYRAQSNTGVGASGTSSPINVTGLSNGTAYTFNVWAINAFGYSAPSDASTSVTPAFSRGVFAGGGYSNVMDYIDITTTGNATDFGDLAAGGTDLSGASSSTRGIISTFRESGTQATNRIVYITLASTGNSSDFGDLTITRTGGMGCSNDTRSIFQGGKDGSTSYNFIDYVTTASTGNATDFGDLTEDRGSMHDGTVNSTTRGIAAGGYDETPGLSKNTIDYITMASTGSSTDFGDLLSNKYYMAGASSATRGLMAGGSAQQNVIQYITIASTGNATDFGDLTVSSNGRGGVCSKTRAVFGGGDGGNPNVMDYVEIGTTGNATDFGDLTVNRGYLTGVSSTHGGLS